MKDESSLEGKSIRQTMKTGGLVDDKTVLSLIGTNLDQEKCRNGALFDGFPRTIHQGEELEKLLAARGKRLDAALEYAVRCFVFRCFTFEKFSFSTFED